MGGLNLSFFILEETVFPEIQQNIRNKIAYETARLVFLHPLFIPEWDSLINKLNLNYISLATDINERKRTQYIIDSLIFYSFGFTEDEVELVLENNPYNPTGFFRVDRTLPIEQRQTTLTMEAFKHLKEVGLERFLEEGWELPDYVTEFDRPGIKIWEPEGGWEKSWAEAKAILTEEEWKEFTGEGVVQSNGSEQETEVEQTQQGLF